ncbi:MAG: recombination protein O N-terminal domain-containing protein [Paracoccaceae bacterium]
MFTPGRGLHAGVVRGGTSRKLAPVLQPGARLDLSWRARLEDHLGTFTVELAKSRSAALFGDRDALAALNAITTPCSSPCPSAVSSASPRQHRGDARPSRPQRRSGAGGLPAMGARAARRSWASGSTSPAVR